MLMKGAHRDPVDHSRTFQPRAGESLWLPGLGLIMIGTVMIAGTVAASAYGRSDLVMVLALIAGALVTAGAILIAFEHHRVKRVERQWEADHPPGWRLPVPPA
jgi:hypothetical protein